MKETETRMQSMEQGGTLQEKSGGELTRTQMLEYINRSIPELSNSQIERLYASIWGMTGKC